MKHWPQYRWIAAVYGSRVAARSRVPLMNHIDEGLAIMQECQATEASMKAFCLHPLVQDDESLATNFDWLAQRGPTRPLSLAMEYRATANAFLSHANGPIKLSPLREVNDMLIADKVQNRKDFLLYHKDTHERADVLDSYFRQWLLALGVSEERYQHLAEVARMRTA